MLELTPCSCVLVDCGQAGTQIDVDLRAAGCASNFSHSGGLSVTYNFQPELFPYWRELHYEVLKAADIFLVR
jgi:hypothetical protein